MSFLENVAKSVIESHGDELEKLCFVVPGRRAGLFLRKAIASQKKKAIKSPAFFSVDELFQILGKREITDRLSLVLELYTCWKELKSSDVEPLDTFLNWGETALKDFNEVDNYLVDSQKFFKNLKDIREIEEWSLSEENLTEQQEAYIRFWKDLGELYKIYQSHLEASGLTYSGKLKRHVVSDMSSVIESLPWKKVIVVGLNALSVSEQKLLFGLERAGKAKFYWDVDEFYFNDKNQEAGSFIREYNSNSKPELIRNEFKQPKEIRVYETATQITELKAAGQLLKELAPEDSVSTAVVLADESLMVPLLHSLPEFENGLNITLGYPLKWSPVMSLIDSVVQLFTKAYNQSRGKNRYYYKDFLAVINHPYMNRYLDDLQTGFSTEIIQTLRQYKLIFPSTSSLKKYLDSKYSLEPIEFLFTTPPDGKSFVQLLKKLIELIKNHALSKEDYLANEYTYRCARQLKKIEKYISDYPEIANVNTVGKLIRQFLATESIPFYGEPLQGVQVMGMLETRALDFDRVLLIGANEDALPKPKYDNSFIPFDLKIAYGLPSYRQRDAIYAYYFYRLITSAKKVDIFYSTASESFGSREKSRFIEQLKYHLHKSNAPYGVDEIKIKNSIGNDRDLGIAIPMSQEIQSSINRHLESGLSPTAMNTIIRCPLDYYFKYVVGLREDEEMEEKVEASTFGSAIHDTLEKLYGDYLGQVLSGEIILAMRKKAGPYLDESFRKHYSVEEMKYGSNHITYNIAKAYVKGFLDWEESELRIAQKNNSHITILAVEKKFEAELDLSEFGFTGKLKIKGTADRVDKIGNTYRIIDYKTGTVNPIDLGVQDPFETATEPKKPKALQLLFYTMLYLQSSDVQLDQIQAGIISLKKLSNGFMPLHLKQGRKAIGSPNAQSIEEFKSGLAQTLNTIKSDSLIHDPNSKYCEFCQ